MTDSAIIPSKNPHPIVFMFLQIPYGAMTGYLVVTLGYLLSNAGISPAIIAGLIALQLMPQVIKFLWSPLVDVTLSVKAWHVIATAACAACVLAFSFIPIRSSSLPIFSVVIVVSSFACSFVGIATNSLSAHSTTGNLKGRVSGFLQAGNLGGQGVGGGLGLYLATHYSNLLAGILLAAGFMACSLFLIFVDEPVDVIKVKGIARSMGNLLKDVWFTVKKRAGIIALILCLMPIGTCAAGNLFSAIAKEWHTSAKTVEWITGLAGGGITAVGCLAGGLICDLMDRRIAYVLFGILQAICAIGMAFFPHTELMYIIWTSLYTFVSGLCYSAFNAFVLEVIGKGAAGTKFELYASVSNAPIYMMTAIAGLAYAKWGANGMFNTEAVCCVIGIVLYLIVKVIIEGNTTKTAKGLELGTEL
jgi:PAT family beta-lactamase induction signal transducer AmpG